MAVSTPFEAFKYLYSDFQGNTTFPSSPVVEQHYSVLRPEDYRTQDTVFTFKSPEVGAYVMRIVPDIRAKRDSESEFNVTRLPTRILRSDRLPDRRKSYFHR